MVDDWDPQRDVELKAPTFRERRKVATENARRVSSEERITTAFGKVDYYINGISKEREDMHVACGGSEMQPKVWYSSISLA